MKTKEIQNLNRAFLLIMFWKKFSALLNCYVLKRGGEDLDKKTERFFGAPDIATILFTL